MPEPMRILLPVDVFPPNAGGAAWSTHALATALQARGHRVTAIVPRALPARRIPTAARRAIAPTASDVLGVPVVHVPYPTSSLPFVANWYRHEWLWALLRNVVVAEALRDGALPPRTIIHAQHVQTTPAAVEAGAELGVPVVATVRDHWPVDYFATGLHADRVPYPANSVASLVTDLVTRLGPVAGVLAIAAVPSMLAHLRRRQTYLGRADAVIAVSHYIARRLPLAVRPERVHVLPNIVDVEAIQATCATPPAVAIDGRFVLYVGKLERNKGAYMLPDIMRAARAAAPGQPLPTLVVAGNGALSEEIARRCAEAQIPLRMLPGWTDHDDVLRLMHRADALVFPSAWGEPLSRVLLEASAAGACIVAMPTGGTPEIVEHDRNGLLASDPAALGRMLMAVVADDGRRARLRATALRRARERWTPEVVVAQVEHVYERIMVRYTGR